MDEEILDVLPVSGGGSYPRSAEFYESLLRAAPDAVSICSVDGRILFASDHALSMYGFSSESELVGRDILDFVIPSHRERAAFFFAEFIGGSESGILEYETLRKDGASLWVDVNAAIVREASGSVQAVALFIRDITAKKEMERRLLVYANEMERLARTDLMTGLLNREAGLCVLEVELERAKREGLRVSVVFIDMDGLKTANDVYGHEAGDALILALAECVRGSVRASDHVARMGGDEFVVFLIGGDEAVPDLVLKRLSFKVDEFNLSGRGRTPLRFSHGVATSTPDQRLDAETLLKDADSSMYEEKKAKRCRSGCKARPF